MVILLLLFVKAPSCVIYYFDGSKTQKTASFFIYLTIFVNIIGFGMVFPLIPYYGTKFGSSEATIGLIMASFAVGQFLFSPLWGRLSDRFGRKPIISMALLGLSLSFITFALAHNLFWLFMMRFLQGVFSAAANPVAHAYVADVTTKEERIRGMGNLGAALALGFIFGPGIGGILSNISLEFPFLAAAGLAILNFLFVQIFLPESLAQKSTKLVIKEGLINLKPMYQAIKGEMGTLFILTFLWSYALSNNQVAVPLLGYEKLQISAFLVGLFFSAQGAVSALAQIAFVHKVAARLGEHQTALTGLSLMALALFLMPFSTQAWMMVAAMMVVALGSSLARPTLSSLISKETKEGQGTTMGVATAFESFGRILGPMLGGFLFSSLGYFSPFFVCSAAVFIILLTVKIPKAHLKLPPRILK